jgi:hypothetical protein
MMVMNCGILKHLMDLSNGGNLIDEFQDPILLLSCLLDSHWILCLLRDQQSQSLLELLNMLNSSDRSKRRVEESLYSIYKFSRCAEFCQIILY